MTPVKTAEGCKPDCGSTTAVDSQRPDLIRQAFLLEIVTIAWMIVEATAAISASITARSTSLLAFGLDSVIELISAGVLIWRLNVELRRGQTFSEYAEHMAARIGGGLLIILAAYVIASSGWSLWTRKGAEYSLFGLAVTLAAIPIMYFLSKRKLKIAENLNSRAMRADAMESITCGYLSVVVAMGLAAQLLTGFWWVDAVTSLGIVWFLVKEGREAWNGGECCCS